MKASVEAEIQRILPFLPTTPPDETLEIIKSRGFLKDKRLIYGCEWVYDEVEQKKVRKVKVTCTACGGEDYLPYVSGGCGRYGSNWGFIDTTGTAVTDGNNCLCPCCGCGTTAMSRPSKNHAHRMNDHIFMSIHKVEGHLAVLSWLITKLVTHDGEVRWRSDLYEGAVIIDKTIVRVRGFYKYMCSMTWLDHWEYTQRFDHQFGAFDRDEVIWSGYEETDGTECEKSALVEYLKLKGALYAMEYLKLWLKHPNVENLVTAGFGDILNDCIDDATGYFNCYSKKNFDIKRVENTLDFKKVKPIDILGIEHEDIPIARGGGIQRLQFYKKVKQRFSVELDSEWLEFCHKQNYNNIWQVADLGENNGHRVRIVHLLNYLKSQADKQKETYHRNLVDAGHLRDYWSMLLRVYKALPEELLYPKDLRRAHDTIQERVKAEENKAVNAKIEERAISLSRFNFYDEETGLFIRPAGSYKEFTKEGKTLHHCVETYATRHADGKTNIFFIRVIDEPDVPFYTLELAMPAEAPSRKEVAHVVQNRGKHNCARTEAVEKFEALWLEHVKEIILKERRNVKRNSKARELARAGA